MEVGFGLNSYHVLSILCLPQVVSMFKLCQVIKLQTLDVFCLILDCVRWLFQ